MTHILIVEDDRDNREMAGVILRAVGHAISSAVDALRSIRMAVQGQPDLILMDLALPRVDGWMATRLLQAHPATCHIPVVAFTAHASAEAAARARAAGCTDHVPPKDPDRSICRFWKGNCSMLR